MNERMNLNQFRHDLYYRINVLPLYIPPLRQRREDIAPLAYHFLSQFHHANNVDFSRQAKLVLEHHEWPGNVRELRNCIKRAVILCAGGRIEPHHLCLDGFDYSQSIDGVHRDDMQDTDYIKKTISRHKYNMSAAAKYLGISRQTLYRLVKKHNISLSN